MAAALIDSNIVIDLLRKYPPAENWLRSQRETLGVSRVVYLEVLEGAENKAEQRVCSIY